MKKKSSEPQSKKLRLNLETLRRLDFEKDGDRKVAGGFPTQSLAMNTSCPSNTDDTLTHAC
jgi:hypothetical protein